MAGITALSCDSDSYRYDVLSCELPTMDYSAKGRTAVAGARPWRGPVGEPYRLLHDHHHGSKRAPLAHPRTDAVILPRDLEPLWLDDELENTLAPGSLLIPYPSTAMEAYNGRGAAVAPLALPRQSAYSPTTSSKVCTTVPLGPPVYI